MHYRGDAGRGEAQQEAVHHRLMRHPAGVGKAVLVFEVAAVAVSALEVPHVGSLLYSLDQMCSPERPGADPLPVTAEADGDADQWKEEGGQEDRHHRVVRQHGIEAFAALRRQCACRPEQECEADHGRHGDGDAVLLEGPACRLREGEVFPAVLPDIGQRLRQVQVELVRGGVLAGVVAAAAVVAEVRQLREVAVAEGALGVQCREHRTIALAIAAGIADLGLAAGFLEQISLHGRRPPCLRCVRRRCRWSCRNRRGSPGRGSTRPWFRLRPRGF